MTINFICNPVFINGGWSPWDKRVGGTEECIIEWSTRLKKRGHNVQVFHNGRHGNWEGVIYRDRGEYLDRTPGVTLNVNYPDLKPLEPTVYWTSLLTQGGRDLSGFKEVLVISEYAKNHTGVNHRLVSILPPGYEPDEVKPGKKIPQTVLYASSPDRGLDNLLNVWADVVKVHSHAQLIVTYGADLGDTPNAICLGEVTKEEMNQLYRESDIWCHPANGGELYCMTGIKAQSAGCIPVYFPIMALAETVKEGLACYQGTLESALDDALSYPQDNKTMRKRLAKLKFPTWESTTDLLENNLKKYN